MKIVTTSLPGVVVVHSEVFADHRGTFTRLFCDRELAGIVGSRTIVQVNHSRTLAAGAVRGLHFQLPPHAEMKLVRCLRGRVWDVVVDLRRGSPSFLRWHAEELSPEKANMLVVPEGCGHGFQAMEAGSELLYAVTAHYDKLAERGVRYNDPALGITWPHPVTDLSEKDGQHALLGGDYRGIDT